jgi:hypothetical protein
MGAPANPMERALEARRLPAAGGDTAQDPLGFDQAVELALSSCAVLEP